MKIFIASDHAGYELKSNLVKSVSFLNDEVIDLGTNSSESVDYPDYAFKIGAKVIEENGLGIVICGTGIGVSIACNKVKGIRCAKTTTEKEASLARTHNDANVIALASYTPLQEAINMINIFVNTKFSNDKRHITRIKKITNYEENIQYEH